MMNTDRIVIWKGMLEWVEMTMNTNDAQKQTWQVPCQVSATAKDGEPEVYVVFEIPLFFNTSTD